MFNIHIVFKGTALYKFLANKLIEQNTRFSKVHVNNHKKVLAPVQFVCSVWELIPLKGHTINACLLEKLNKIFNITPQSLSFKLLLVIYQDWFLEL